MASSHKKGTCVDITNLERQAMSENVDLDLVVPNCCSWFHERKLTCGCPRYGMTRLIQLGAHIRFASAEVTSSKT